MKLEQFIETLSEEERERHKDLIDECRSRVEYTRKCLSTIYPGPTNLSAERKAMPGLEETLEEVRSAIAG